MKVLELRFTNEMGKVATLTIDDPKEPVDPIKVAAVMEELIVNNVFTSSGGSFLEKADARIIKRTIENIAFQ